MTEQEWLACKDPEPMLELLRGKQCERKLRLFACACCRRIWPLLKDERGRQAVELAERFSDGLTASNEMMIAGLAAEDASNDALDKDDGVLCNSTAAAMLTAQLEGVHELLRGMPNVFANVVDPGEEAGLIARPAMLNELAGLFRHIFGNPFRPYPAPPSWPSAVVQLAESLYGGQDWAFALHDALLEAGHAELAEHFRREPWHPKGCFAMDAILGKS
jgi:hypothetical protein